MDRRSDCGSSHTTNLCEKMGDDVLNLLYLHESERQQLAMNLFGYHFAVASETTGVCWRNGVSIFYIVRHYVDGKQCGSRIAGL